MEFVYLRENAQAKMSEPKQQSPDPMRGDLAGKHPATRTVVIQRGVLCATTTERGGRLPLPPPHSIPGPWRQHSAPGSTAAGPRPWPVCRAIQRGEGGGSGGGSVGGGAG